MSWLRIDDKFGQHPKVLALSDREFRVHVLTLCYCAEYGTDGNVPRSAWRSLGISGRIARTLVANGLWDLDGDEYTVHNWRTFNPIDPTSGTRKERWKERWKERQRNGEGTDEERNGNGPHARAGARVPSRPVPEDERTSSSDARAMLTAFGIGDPAILGDASLEPSQIAACIAASSNARDPVAYVAHLLRTGQTPQPPRTDPRTKRVNVNGPTYDRAGRAEAMIRNHVITERIELDEELVSANLEPGDTDRLYELLDATANGNHPPQQA